MRPSERREQFQWPDKSLLRHAEQVLAGEREKRWRQARQRSKELRTRCEPDPVSDEDTVLLVVSAIRGDR